MKLVSESVKHQMIALYEDVSDDLNSARVILAFPKL